MFFSVVLITGLGYVVEKLVYKIYFVCMVCNVCKTPGEFCDEIYFFFYACMLVYHLVRELCKVSDD